jgi:anthranilate synthase component 1
VTPAVAALQPGEALPLVRTLDRCPDPVALFDRLTEGGRRRDTLLLESGDTSTQRGENSLLVVRAALRLTCRGRTVAVTALGADGRSLLPWLAEHLRGRAADIERSPDGLLVRFAPPPTGDEEERLRAPSPMDVLRALVRGPRPAGGEAAQAPLVAGVFAYDLLGTFETLPEPREDPLGWPDYELWLPDRLIWLNHRLRRATIVAHVHGGPEADRAYHDAVDGVTELTRAVEAAPPRPEGGPAGEPPGPAGEPPGPAGEPPGPAPIVDLSDDAYAALVERAKRHIVAGDVFQLVPSRTFSLPCPDPLAAYRELRALNPSPYMFLVNGERGTLFGASPETAVRVAPEAASGPGTGPVAGSRGGALTVEIRPIAGTRPRARRPDGSVDHDLDSRLEAELRLDTKELAEHLMLVDLARNDVARVSAPGTRWVDRLLTVERYSHVMHLVSNVRGRLRDDLDALHAYVATMNMGTLVGAPKLKAAELLRRYEATRRGPYGGAVGYVTADGRMDTSIVIRSAVVQDGTAHVRAGAGVVHDSVPAAEAAETRRKAEAVLQALRRVAR